MSNSMIKISVVGNPSIGYLSFFEMKKEIPFEIKRIYYTYSVPIGERRGMHAHKTLKQFLWCPHGEIEVILDDGKIKTKYMLDSPEKGLLILKGYWRDIYFKKEGSVLCVAASDYYKEDDYIRDYDEFIKHFEKGYWGHEDKL